VAGTQLPSHMQSMRRDVLSTAEIRGSRDITDLIAYAQTFLSMSDSNAISPRSVDVILGSCMDML